MGILVLNYTTAEGFFVPTLYVQVESMRILKTLNGPNYSCYFSSSAWKSPEDKANGARPVPIPSNLANAETFLTADQFYDQTIFGYAYDALKAGWQNAGFTVEDYYPHPPTPTTYIYDCSGYNFQGFNCAGYDREGYDKDGYNKAGYDRDGYDRQGYDKDGYNRQGFDRDGYDREGYDYQGCNREHKDRQGNECPAPPPGPDISGNIVDLSGNTTDLSGNTVTPESQ
jgi:hypothetical protein